MQSRHEQYAFCIVLAVLYVTTPHGKRVAARNVVVVVVLLLGTQYFCGLCGFAVAGAAET